MPRKVDPGTIKVGPGKTVPGESDLFLGGAGMAGAGPNIGDGGGTAPAPGEGSSDALKAHVNSGKAHPASAIFTEEGPKTLSSGNVEGQLDELAGALPPEPPKLGYVHSHLDFTGIPDWGNMKLADMPLHELVSSIASPNDAANIFPYYYTTPTPTQDSGFPSRGHDPESDYAFNTGASPILFGGASAGAYTRPPTGPSPAPVVRTTCIMRRAGGPNTMVVSGSVYPADRGVLALLHWPPGGDIAAFKAQPLISTGGVQGRVVCAALLGQGILGDSPCDGGKCDGGLGGIFDPGTGAQGEYDPFSFPGQASGQYSLGEIGAGLDMGYGEPLRAPWDDADGDGFAGWKRYENSTIPGPGQVRLGTDPDAGEGTLAYGIPILGGDDRCYSDVPGGSPPGPTLGDTYISPTGMPYFRYRLPYLKDYSKGTGLKWTPGGSPGSETTAKEKYRFYTPPPVFVAPEFIELSQAGNYSDFPGDEYTWQVARFRIAFDLQFHGAPEDYEEHGTYFFMHFKREKDFESFVRDGVMPDDPTDGYETFSARPTFLPDPSIESTGNRVNEETSFTVESPAGPAPEFGYKALPYHIMRVNVFEEPGGFQIGSGNVLVKQGVFTATNTMPVSGVPYYTTKNQTTGASEASLSDLDLTVGDFWGSSYRTDPRPLVDPTGTPAPPHHNVTGIAPALLAAQNPVFLGLAPFAYEDPSLGSYSVTEGPAGSSYTGPALTASPYWSRRHRIEIPFTHCRGTSAYTDADGPLWADQLIIDGSGLASPQDTVFLNGDVEDPAFSSDARVRAYLRMPMGNTYQSPDDGIQPANAGTGEGPGAVLALSPDKILYHSTSFDPVNLHGEFGNFLTGVAPSPAYAPLATAEKDVHERFLDEVYRYQYTFLGIDAVYGPGSVQALSGPGLGYWVPSPIETPVRIGTQAGMTVWQVRSFSQNENFNNVPLFSSRPYLQVAGLPDRNPKLRYGQTVPFPSAGLCMYPHKDYSTGYDPVGPDYSALSGLRTYIRCFDAGFGGVVDAVGQHTFTIRIDGIQLQDFQYRAPGPGSIADKEGIAILVKVPGLTTWMDLGRPDGSGRSKQDATADGAGCKVLGPETFDGVDEQTRHVYAQVKVNVGPFASLFLNTGVDNVDLVVPVLVKVMMDHQPAGIPKAANFNLEQGYDPNTRTFLGATGAETSPEDVRGIIGIRLVQP